MKNYDVDPLRGIDNVTAFAFKCPFIAQSRQTNNILRVINSTPQFLQRGMSPDMNTYGFAYKNIRLRKRKFDHFFGATTEKIGFPIFKVTYFK